MTKPLPTQTLKTLVLACSCIAFLQGCVPLIATGVTTGVSATLDRRTYGTQIQDQEIEIRVARAIDRQFDDKVSISTTSFNRWVLLTGQASTESYRAEAEKIARETPNVRQVFNEVTVGWPSSFGTSANDRLITTKVKARLLDPDVKSVSGHNVKVLTESGVVYLMGTVAEYERKAAVEIARTTRGAEKVVDLFEIISDEEVRRLNANLPQPPGAGSSAPKAAP